MGNSADPLSGFADSLRGSADLMRLTRKAQYER